MSEENEKNTLSSLLYLSQYEPSNIPKEDLKQQMEFYFSSVNQFFYEIKDQEVNLSSKLLSIPMIIVNLVILQSLYDSNFEDKNHDFLNKIIHFDYTPKEKKIEAPKKSFFNNSYVFPDVDPFLSIINKMFKSGTSNYKTFIEFSFALNQDIRNFFPDLVFDVFPNPIQDLFVDFEFTNESVQSIFEMIPQVEKPKHLVIYRFLIEIIYGTNIIPRISANNLIDIITSRDFPEMQNDNLCRLILYFNTHTNVYRGQDRGEPNTKPLSMFKPKYLPFMLLGKYIDLEDIVISDLTTPFELFVFQYYHCTLNDDASIRLFNRKMDSFIKPKLYLAKYIISNTFLDVNLIYLLKESLTDSKAAVKLLSHPNCIPYLSKTSPIHQKVLSFFQPDSKDIKLPNKFETLNDLILLYRFSEYRKKNPLTDDQLLKSETETFSSILKNLSDYTLESTLSYTNYNGSASALLQGGFQPPQLPASAESPILKSPQLLIDTKEVLPFQMISSIIYYLSEFDINPSILDDILILLIHTYISNEAKEKLKKKLIDCIYNELYNKEKETLRVQAENNQQQQEQQQQQQNAQGEQNAENQQLQIPEPDTDALKTESNKLFNNAVNTYISNMIVLGIMESDSQLSTSYSIVTHKALPDCALISTMKLLQNNSYNLLTFFTHSNLAKEKFTILPDDMKLKILSLLIESDEVDAIGSLKLTQSFDIPTLLEISGKYIVSHTECISIILIHINDQIKDIDPFLRNLPESFDFPQNKVFNNVVCNSASLFLNIMNTMILSHCYDEAEILDNKEPFTAMPSIQHEWSEDSQNNGSDENDIWNKETPLHVCSENKDHSKSQHVFRCYTCKDNPNICEYCAATCHKYHDIVYLGKGDDQCKCAQCSDNTCVCCNEEKLLEYAKQMENNDEDIIDDVASEEIPDNNLCHADPQLLVKTLIKLSKSKDFNLSSNNDSSGFLIATTFHNDIKTWEIPKQRKDDNRLPPPLIFKKKVNVYNNVGTGGNVSNDLKRVNESFLNTRRRAEVAPMPLGMTVRNGQYVLECCGCTVRILSRDLTQEVSSIQIKKVALMASLCPTDESLLAISTLNNVYLFDITEKGIISQRSEVNLDFQNRSSSAFVNSVRWVPSKPQHLMVVSNAFVKIFNVASDVTTPLLTFDCDRSDYITSSSTFMHDNKPYGIFAVYPGKIAIQDLSVQSNDSLKLKNFAKFRPRYDSHSISISEEANMLFISYSRTLIVMRPEEVFNENPHYIEVKTNFEGHLVYLCMYPNLPVIVFTHTSTNSLFTLTFTDDDCIFSHLHSTKIPVQTFAALDNTMNFLSVFPFHDKMIAVSAQNGQTYQLLINMASEKKVDTELTKDYDPDLYETIDIPLVPSNFWIESSTDTSNIEVYNNFRDSINDVLSGCRYIFSGSTQKKTVYVRLNDSERVIVGFRIGVGSNGESHRPPWIAVGNKKKEVTMQRSYMFSLEPEEIEPMKTYEIRFASRSDNEINFDRLAVFHVDKKSVEKICKEARGPSDWKDGSELSDFTPPFPESILQACALSLAYSFKPSPLNDDDFEQLVSIAYTNNSLCYAARYILSQCNSENKESKWAELAAKFANDVNTERKVEFWRDFQLFPQETKSAISNRIWEQNPIKDENNAQNANDDNNNQENGSIEEGLILSAFFATV